MAARDQFKAEPRDSLPIRGIAYRKCLEMLVLAGVTATGEEFQTKHKLPGEV
jgi:hypothetical protein